MIASKETQIDHASLRRVLRGYYFEIAEKCNVSMATVSRVINGKQVNFEVWDYAVQLQKRVIKQKQLQVKKMSKPLSIA